MSLRRHREKAAGKRDRSHRMPSPDEIKLGTKIKENDKHETEEAIKCDQCGNWFGSGDLENGICSECLRYSEDSIET